MINQTTLLLDQTAWDLVLDSAGNIALAGAPYSIAQDVASAVRTFLGECWYDTTQGMPYWQEILGQLPPLSLVKHKIETVAMTVPNVVSAVATFTKFSDRALEGAIQITDTDSTVSTVYF